MLQTYFHVLHMSIWAALYWENGRPPITNSSVTIRTHANTGFPSAALAYSKTQTWMPWLSPSVDLAIGCCFAIGSRADRCLYRSFLSMGVLFGRQVPHYSVLAGMGNAPC